MGQSESNISTKDNSSDENCEVYKKSKTQLKVQIKNKLELEIDSEENIKNKPQSDNKLTLKNLGVKEKEEKEKDKKNIQMTFGSLNFDIRKNYVFKEMIGGGRYGKVRVACKKKCPERLYAIKSINKKKLSKKEFSNLTKEVEILSSLDHPNIIKFHETYQDELYFHIVTDLCTGKELLENIIREGHLSEQKVCKIIFKVLSAISYCHSMNISHRDLKPENIIFDTKNIDSEIKIIDFGLSTKYNDGVKMHSVLGTPYYIAPEVLKGDFDEKCDVWSIGSITYLMLTGQTPFNGDSIKEIFQSIISKKLNFSLLEKEFSEEAIDFLKSCLTRDPTLRSSAQNALKHNWFKSINQEIHANNHLNRDALDNLRKFTAPGEFKKMILKFIVNNVNENEIKLLKEAFNALDYEQNGKLKLSCLEEGFKQAGIEIPLEELMNVFAKVDINHNGKYITYSEFLIAAMDQKQFMKENFISAFNYYDFDCSGFIDKLDLENALLITGNEIFDKTDLDKVIGEINCNENKISMPAFLTLFGY